MNDTTEDKKKVVRALMEMDKLGNLESGNAMLWPNVMSDSLPSKKNRIKGILCKVVQKVKQLVSEE